MRKANINGKSNLRKVDPNWFTGRTWMRSVSDVIGSEGHDMYHVHFESGSRTKLHAHNGDQILMATKGAGSLEVFEKLDGSRRRFAIRRTRTVKLSAGDVVYIPAGMLHTHGSVDKKRTFSHVAINVLPGRRGGNASYKTIWYESDFERSVSAII